MTTTNPDAGGYPHDATADPFEDVLNLEEQYYAEGYALGVADGSQAGRVEGRQFGLEKGFEKFLEMGRLGGRTAVWCARAASVPSTLSAATSTSSVATMGGARPRHMPGGERLQKHLDRLDALTEAVTMSTENSEEAVAAFDDRLRDAKAKAALVVKLVGDEHNRDARSTRDTLSNSVTSRAPTGEMEDFMALSQVRQNTAR